MTLSLVRLDDRLVHGQVVIGWGNALGIECLVLIDDHVRKNESEQELHALGDQDEAFDSKCEPSRT